MHLSETPDAWWLYNEKFTLVFFLIHWHIDFVFILLMHGSPTSNKWGPGILQKKMQKGVPRTFWFNKGETGRWEVGGLFLVGATRPHVMWYFQEYAYWFLMLIFFTQQVKGFAVVNCLFCSSKLFVPFFLVGLTFI